MKTRRWYIRNSRWSCLGIVEAPTGGRALGKWARENGEERIGRVRREPDGLAGMECYSGIHKVDREPRRRYAEEAI